MAYTETVCTRKTGRAPGTDEIEPFKPRLILGSFFGDLLENELVSVGALVHLTEYEFFMDIFCVFHYQKIRSVLYFIPWKRANIFHWLIYMYEDKLHGVMLYLKEPLF